MGPQVDPVPSDVAMPKEADVVIRPDIPGIGSTDFKSRNDAILEGERAAQAALPLIRAKLGIR